jgi:hypothetical protein
LSGLGVRDFLVNGGVSGRGGKRFGFHFGPLFLKWLIPPPPPMKCASMASKGVIAQNSAICALAERTGDANEGMGRDKEAGCRERLRWEEGACRGCGLSITSRVMIARNC